MGSDVRIVGGGLAGLTLGLLLRREGVPVEISEAGSYPRRRVCGEFISGRGVRILQALNIPGVPLPEGTHSHAVRFFDFQGSSKIFPLPEPALAIDRARLDHLLAIEFQRAGGVLRENCRWTEPFATEGVVRATGRRLQKRASNGLLGVKVHARNLPLCADLEMHFSDAGYLGLSRQPRGVVNVCALFRNSARLRSDHGHSKENLRETLSCGMGDALRERLQLAEFDDRTFSAVAGISLKREPSKTSNECRIGDTICMIPPLTGNGMSIALETASIAAPYLRDYSAGRLAWSDAVARISRACDKTLRRRLGAAAIFQRLCFTRAGRRGMLQLLRFVPGSLNTCFRLTR